MTGFEREYELLLREGLKQSALRQEYEKKVEALRELGRQYKEAPPTLLGEYIYAATAARPIKDLDERITAEGFRMWYRQRENKLK